MKRIAVFLDRDGTINADPGYISTPHELHIFPTARTGLKLLENKNLLLFIVTNQSGLGRGYFTPQNLSAVHQKLEKELARDGVHFQEIVFCPHRPDENCDCRKPSPKLVLELARKYGVDLRRSFFIGDKNLDIQTGINAGCRTILLASPERLVELRREPEWRSPGYIVLNLHEAALIVTDLLGEEKKK